MDKLIPLSIPNFEGNEEKYVVDAITSTFVSTVGGYVSRIEYSCAMKSRFRKSGNQMSGRRKSSIRDYSR